MRSRPRFAGLSDPRALINAVLPDYQPGDEAEERARAEKAAGLAELYASPLSVLIGPAGTGKTTLLRALVEQLAGGRVVLLAPTGKARVQLGGQVTTATLASFLRHSGRFDGERYLVLDEHAVRIDSDLVVIDEASVLTEEMLAAILDALRSIGRLILVGDPRQLPPIGPGRPFGDLVSELRPAEFSGPARVGPSYVELRVPRRQPCGAGQPQGDGCADRARIGCHPPPANQRRHPTYAYSSPPTRIPGPLQNNATSSAEDLGLWFSKSFRSSAISLL
jgi:hypothetical protein